MNNYVPVFLLNQLVILPNQEIKIDITNEISKRVIKQASKNNNQVLVIAPQNYLESSPSIDDLPKVGVLTNIKSKIELSNGNLRVVLRGEMRVHIAKYYHNSKTNILKCTTEIIEIPSFDETTATAIRRKLKDLIKEYIDLNNHVTNSILHSINKTEDLNIITDLITCFMPFTFAKKLEYMQTINPINRANLLIKDIQEEINISNIDKELNEKIQENLENSQREFILKEKLKEINNELGNNKDEEVTQLIEDINNLKLSNTITNKLMNEVRKFANTSDYSPESAVLKNYLDTIINLPWHRFSNEEVDVKAVQSYLNQTHYGLTEVKDRICEYVSLKKKNPFLTSPIICLVGPPGVGKTSIAMAIAKALKREFYKISVGGLNDSTELIGSRKTYLGASPGKIIQGILKCQVNNPVMLIDEIDKMVKDYKGDPAATLLEILDETQNQFFIDNYLEEPFDISHVFFILTANNVEDIPYTLLDRLEIINISSYSLYEKIDIARNFLLKNILETYQSNLKVTKETLEYIILHFTKEPGVRELKRCLDKIVRKIEVNEKDAKSITINLACKYLGKEIENYLPSIRDYGIANVLAYTNMGGQIAHVEVSKVKGTGRLIITGNAGDVLKESVQVAFAYIVNEYEIEYQQYDVYVHFTQNGLKKNGPSAGSAVAAAILSMFYKKVLSSEVAFTGEITLKGNVLPVGGLKEKLIAATTENVKMVYIPKANEMDLTDIPTNVFEKVAIKLVSNFSEIYDGIFH